MTTFKHFSVAYASSELPHEPVVIFFHTNRTIKQNKYMNEPNIKTWKLEHQIKKEKHRTIEFNEDQGLSE